MIRVLPRDFAVLPWKTNKLKTQGEKMSNLHLSFLVHSLVLAFEWKWVNGFTFWFLCFCKNLTGEVFCEKPWLWLTCKGQNCKSLNTSLLHNHLHPRVCLCSSLQREWWADNKAGYIYANVYTYMCIYMCVCLSIFLPFICSHLLMLVQWFW